MFMFTQGTLARSIFRATVAALSFGIPLITLAIPHWADVTVGAIIFGLLHYAETKSSS